MNAIKRKRRAARRAKTMRLIRNRGIPATPSKYGYQSPWRGDGLTPGEVMSVRKKARRTAVSP
jgi:hypothetical protein